MPVRVPVRKVLYILRKGASELPDRLLPKGASPDEEVSVLLIHEAVTLPQAPGNRTYALLDDVTSRNLKPSFPTISYGEMLRLIFDADTVIAL